MVMVDGSMAFRPTLVGAIFSRKGVVEFLKRGDSLNCHAGLPIVESDFVVVLHKRGLGAT
jgi:hypothetical protein